MPEASRDQVKKRSSLIIRVGAGAACVGIAVGALTGSEPSTTARGQVGADPYNPQTAIPRPRPPLGSVPGVTNRIRAVDVPGYRGPVLVCRRPGAVCREVDGSATVSIGAYLDTTKGAARLETTSAGGAFTGMVVYAGSFQLQQARQPGAVLRARLIGRSPTGCARGSLPSGRSSAKKRKARRLWSDGSGRFRSDGRYGSATVRGTKWLMEERCSGTFFRVTRGRIAVEDRPRAKTVEVRAPRTYLVRPRR